MRNGFYEEGIPNSMQPLWVGIIQKWKPNYVCDMW